MERVSALEDKLAKWELEGGKRVIGPRKAEQSKNTGDSWDSSMCFFQYVKRLLD